MHCSDVDWVDVDNGEGVMDVWGQRVYGSFLYPSLSFLMNLKLISINEIFIRDWLLPSRKYKTLQFISFLRYNSKYCKRYSIKYKMLLFVSTYIDESIIFFRVTKTNNRTNVDNDWYIRKWPHFKCCMSQSNLNFPFSNILRNVYSKFVYKINMSQVLQEQGQRGSSLVGVGSW